jgi:hypothetical protein
MAGMAQKRNTNRARQQVGCSVTKLRSNGTTQFYSIARELQNEDNKALR